MEVEAEMKSYGCETVAKAGICATVANRVEAGVVGREQVEARIETKGVGSRRWSQRG